MIKMKNPLRVECGTIYTEDGIGIDKMSVILDKTVGLMKYGDADWINEYYSEMVSKYSAAGFEGMTENLMLINFDKYDGLLDIDAICTFVNYMILCSGNSKKIMEILSMAEDKILVEIMKLKGLGY